ncbi:MAG: hypothetical protein KME43_25340 [Myxacorys chilensis ATA2-1-KO14]|jgi:hypothetical protein|nr:hypothetical protein [Myxacorys chilensis ATA2-1-KO14]
MLKPEVIGILISVLSFCFGIMAFVWKASTTVAAMKTDLRELNLVVQHNGQLGDEKLGRMNDCIVLGFNNVKEALQHLRTRQLNEQTETDHRVEDLEDFLAKTTAFEKRR